MKTIREKVKPDGTREVTVRLAPGEKLVAINEGLHYRLGYPLEDVVGGHVISDPTPVSWCCIEQKWVD